MYTIGIVGKLIKFKTLAFDNVIILKKYRETTLIWIALILGNPYIYLEKKQD